MSTPQTTTEKNTSIESQKPKGLKDWIQSDAFKSAINQALPKHMTTDRFARVCLTALMKSPKLLDCTKESVFKAMLDCSSLGLEPDGRRAHLIPYGKTCELIIDYKGLIELAKRSGEVKNWRAELICENDEFSWSNGIVEHKVNWLKSRGKALAVYSHVRNKDDIDDYEVMTMQQVEAVRKRSKAGNNGPWVTDFDEMAKKSVIRRHSKRLTLSPEFMEALQKDGDRYDDIPSLTLDDMKPKRLSDAPNHAPSEKDIEVTPESPKVNPDSKIGNASLAKIMKSMEANPNITKPMLMEHLAVNYKIEKLGDLKEWQVEDVFDFINSSEREPGSDDGELPDFDQ